MNKYPFYWEICSLEDMRQFILWWEVEATPSKKDMAIHITRIKLRDRKNLLTRLTMDI